MAQQQRTRAWVFTIEGARIGGWNLGGHHWMKTYRRVFGCTPLKHALLWDAVKAVHGIPDGIKHKHLLWGTFWLRHYSTEDVGAATMDTTEKTFRGKVWTMVELIATLNLINWDNRKVRACQWNVCFVSVDGMDFRIMEQHPFNRRWYLHKFHGPGVRYKVAIAISTG